MEPWLSIFAVWPLLTVILVAITTTKGPLLLKQGFWAAMHEGRTDFCMIVVLVAIALLGAGPFSLDRRWGVKLSARNERGPYPHPPEVEY